MKQNAITDHQLQTGSTADTCASSVAKGLRCRYRTVREELLLSEVSNDSTLCCRQQAKTPPAGAAQITGFRS